MIEVKKATSLLKRSTLIIEGDFIESDSKMWYHYDKELSVSDINLSRRVATHRFDELPIEFNKFDLHTVYEFFEEAEFYINTTIHRGESLEFSINVRFYLPNWKQPFNILEYVNELVTVAEKKGQKAIRQGMVIAGVFIFFLVDDMSSTIEAAVLKRKDLIKELHENTTELLFTKLSQEGKSRIFRSIEFPPEYRSSGITILSYFAEVLRHKKLSEDVKVSIEQSGLNVSLVIESPTGQREQVERTLEAYALVVTGKQPIDTLTTDPYEAAELKSQLRIASAQIESQRDLLAVKTSEAANLRTDVEETKASLKRLEQRSDEDRARFMSLIEKLATHNADLAAGFKELAQQAAQSQNQALAGALENLYMVIERGVEEEDHDEVIRNLSTIRQQDPGVFQRVYDVLIMGAISGAAGNYLYAWLQAFVYGLPK